MLNYLNTFNLYGVEIYAMKNKDFEGITLGMPNKGISEDDKIALTIVNNYFEKFLVETHKYLYDKLEVAVLQRGYSLNDNAQDIIFPLIASYFKKYVLEFEIEIACDIEREKSPYYKSIIKTFSITKNNLQ